MHAHAIASVRAEWLSRSRSPRAAAVFDRLVAAEEVLAGAGASSLHELFASLERAGGTAAAGAGQVGAVGGATPHWEIVAALIRRFDTDELVGLGLVAALSPGLLKVARRLDWGQGGPWPDAQCFAADLVSETWLVLREAAGTTLAYPERTVIDRLRRRLAHRRSSFQQATQREAPSDDAALAETVDRQPGTWSEPRRGSTLESLAAALAGVDHPVLRREDVRLVFETRVLGYSIAELAQRGAGCRRTLELRRCRAEALLCA
jgi:hypothetical protein